MHDQERKLEYCNFVFMRNATWIKDYIKSSQDEEDEEGEEDEENEDYEENEEYEEGEEDEERMKNIEEDYRLKII